MWYNRLVGYIRNNTHCVALWLEKLCIVKFEKGWVLEKSSYMYLSNIMCTLNKTSKSSLVGQNISSLCEKVCSIMKKLLNDIPQRCKLRIRRVLYIIIQSLITHVYYIISKWFLDKADFQWPELNIFTTNSNKWKTKLSLTIRKKTSDCSTCNNSCKYSRSELVLRVPRLGLATISPKAKGL